MASETRSDGDQAIRDRLALVRTQLANERTVLAYVRTAIMFAVTGATVLKFYSARPFSVASGWALIVVGIGVAAFGASRFRRLRRTFR